jgi:hypothetical protein
MFTNLIESSSHAKEFKRRGSFLLFTTATYVVLFVITGVVSIYAYDTHLEEQNLEVVMLLPPQEIVPDTPRPVAEPPRNTSNNVRSQYPSELSLCLASSIQKWFQTEFPQKEILFSHYLQDQ